MPEFAEKVTLDLARKKLFVNGNELRSVTLTFYTKDIEVIPECAEPDQSAFLAEERLRHAREALVRTGYFTADQVGDDVAPRIIELASHYTEPDSEPACP